MKQKYDEILNLFIHPKRIRERLRKPFIQGEFIHATDSYALVSIPKSLANEYDEAPVEQYLNLEKIITVQDPQAKIILGIKKIEREINKADLIDEMSEVERDCEYCEGDGYRRCDMDEDHDCIDCDGSGRFPAPTPTGKKVPDPEQSFGFRMTYISYQNLKKVLKVAEILGENSVTITVSAKEKKPVNFQVGEALITIMPRSGADMNSIIII